MTLATKTICAAGLLLALVAVACGSEPPTPTTPVAPVVSVTLSKLTISVVSISDPSFIIGSTEQLSATAVFSDATQQDVTAVVTWQSSDSTIATVSKTGLVTAIDMGTATIGAAYEAQSATLARAVAPKPLAVRGGCGSAKAGTYDSLACTAFISGATNPQSTGLALHIDLSAFGLGNNLTFQQCYGCGEPEYDMDFPIPSNMSPGPAPVIMTVSDAQGRKTSITVYFTVLPG